ncbi:MAG TPA: 3-deoxy-D-manno-octulosonate 8-phosphate phosphatase, partial [Acidobacteriota bacterium]|nr:3-deoxy-D-manno-octulosonate 8-phosphate phosphatase [Acidobacteriota bacterium]
MHRVSQKPCDLSRIRLVVTDMDGVWTDGSIYLDDRGIECKRFSAYDGLGVRLATEAGLRIAILSGRASAVVALRAAALGVERIVQNSSDKGPDFLKLCQEMGIPPGQT